MLNHLSDKERRAITREKRRVLEKAAIEINGDPMMARIIVDDLLKTEKRLEEADV